MLKFPNGIYNAKELSTTLLYRIIRNVIQVIRVIEFHTDLNVRNILVVRVKNGTSDLRKVQYHVANVAARIISPSADTKNRLHNIPITFTAVKYYK